jgi:hypothetical protein
MADKTLKEHVVAFRIPEAQAQQCEKMLADQPIVGVKSINQLFRKIGRDFLAGRLSYKNQDDSRIDSE